MTLPIGWRTRVAKVLETFSAEAGVLLLVFPLLDEFVQRGRQGISWKLIAASLGGSAVCLAIALIIAAVVKEEEH